MLQDVNAANAARANKLHANDIRRLTASSRSGVTYNEGDLIIVQGHAVPDVLAIDANDENSTRYLAYDTNGQPISYKSLLGKRVILAKLPEGAKPSAGMTYVDGNGQSHEVFLVERKHFVPRTSGTVPTERFVTAAGDSIDVLSKDTTLKVAIKSAYPTCLPEGIKQQPTGSYYCYKVDNYATFEVQ